MPKVEICTSKEDLENALSKLSRVEFDSLKIVPFEPFTGKQAVHFVIAYWKTIGGI